MNAAVFRFVALSLIFGMLANPAAAQSPYRPVKKKLIEFGWDEPDAAFLRKHIAEMEKTPFDGTVFHLNGEFLWQCWGKKTLKEADAAAPVEDLKRTPIKRFTHNFLRFNVTPGDVDWFDDFGPIVNNARLAAKFAKAGRAAGILFDIEQYNAPVFNYGKQPDAKTKSWDQYAVQVRKRGREVMAAFQQEFPNIVILTTWSYSLPFQQAKGDAKNLPKADYGLLKPLFDGMFDAAEGTTKIVDGYESSYGYKTAEQFDKARRRLSEGLPGFVADRERFAKYGSQGFGVWMDNDWRRKGWDEKEFAKNHFSPEQFEASVKAALGAADEYVWIYTEKPKWWTEPVGKPAGLSTEYERALRRAAGRN